MKASTLGKAVTVSLGVIALFMFGCAGTQNSFSARGVAPKVVLRADSIAARLFVARKLEREAEILNQKGVRHYQACDSILALLRKETKESKPQTAPAVAADSLRPPGNAVAGTPRAASPVNVRLRQLEIQSKYNLLQARDFLEKSLRLNPLQLRAKHFLALTYKIFAERFPRTMPLDEAMKIWTDLAAVEPGEYFHFYNLGACQYALRQWEQAWHNFKRTEEVLLASTEVSDKRLWNPALLPHATLDSLILFEAIYYQGQCAIKRFDDKQALANLERAKILAKTSAEVGRIEDEIRWIKWDGGNILASVYRDSAFTLVTQGRHAEAAKIYEKLYEEILKTKRAKDEIVWDYAGLEYHHLHRKVAAIRRMDGALKDIPKDEEGAPLDTTYNLSFNNYGAMCYNFGIDTLKVDRRLAYDYFERAAAIKWKKRGLSYLQMAELSQSNADLSIRNGENAMALVHQLDNEQVKKLYRLLIDSYRRKNQMDKARPYFEKLRAMK